MRLRWLSLGIVIGLVLVLTLGFASAASRDRVAPGLADAGMMGGSSEVWTPGGMQAMHDSPAMRRMHEQMPAGLQKQCDAMHAAMGSSGHGAMMPGMMSS